MVYFAACMKGGCRVFSASGKLKSDVARENEILAHPVRLGAENKWIFLVFPQRRVSAPRATYRRKKTGKSRENRGKLAGGRYSRSIRDPSSTKQTILNPFYD